MAKSEATARKKCPECDGAGYVEVHVEGMDDTVDRNGRRRIITGGYTRIA